MDNNIYFWLAVSVISASIASILLKQYTISWNIILLFVVALMYVLLAYSFIMIYQGNQVSSTFAIVNILQTLFVVIVGYIVFSETLSIMQIVGIILAIIALYLLAPAS